MAAAPSQGRRDRRVIVTGGAGFIGSHVVDAFIELGYEAVVVDDLSTGLERNVAADAAFERIDIVDGAAVERVVSSVRPVAICHLAAQSSVTVSVKTPERDLAVNVLGTLNVLQAARRVGAPVVFSSTGGALYGDRASLPTSEDTVFEPLAPYGASKAAGEAYLGTWGRLHGIPNVVLRLGNVYGPRQRSDGEAGVVSIFSDRLRRGEAPVVFGDGKPTRDYVHVTDVARSFVLAAEGGRAGVFNVGTGIESTALDVLAVLQEEAGTSLAPQLEPLRPGELLRSALDATRIRNELGWSPDVGLRQGLIETYRALAG